MKRYLELSYEAMGKIALPFRDDAIKQRLQQADFHQILPVECHVSDDKKWWVYSQDIPRDWQPIETAPKDGTEILLCNAQLQRCGVGSWGIARPQGQDAYRANQGRPAWLAYDAVHLFPNPTHWQPLPELPRG